MRSSGRDFTVEMDGIDVLWVVQSEEEARKKDEISGRDLDKIGEAGWRCLRAVWVPIETE